MRGFLIAILLLVCGQNIYATPRNIRDYVNLSVKDQEFSHKLSRKQRKIFCSQFNRSQRERAILYVMQGEKNPDQAVIRVMEETGMPLATKKRQENTVHR